MKQLPDLELNKTWHDAENKVFITKVPSGWIYYYPFHKSSTFVPDNTQRNSALRSMDESIHRLSGMLRHVLEENRRYGGPPRY